MGCAHAAFAQSYFAWLLCDFCVILACTAPYGPALLCCVLLLLLLLFLLLLQLLLLLLTLLLLRLLPLLLASSFASSASSSPSSGAVGVLPSASSRACDMSQAG